MRLTVQYFGKLVDISGKIEEFLVFDTSTKTSLQQVLGELHSRYPGLKDVTYKTAVNQLVCRQEDTLLNEGDCLALLPLFAGG